MDLIAANQQELDTFINKQPELSVGELDILFNNAQIQTNRMIDELREQDSVTLAAQKYRLVDSTGENDQRTLRVLAANQQMFDTHVNNQLERGVSFDQLDIEFSQAQAVVDKTISNLRDEDDTYMSAQKYQLVAEVGKNDQRAMDIVADHQLALDTLINEQRHLVFNMDDLDILVYRAQSTLDKAMYDMRARSEEMDDYFGLDTNTTDRITVLRETPGTKRGIPEPYKLIPTPPVTKESPKKEKPLGQGSVTHPNYVVLTTEGLRCHGILCKYPVGVTAEDIVLGWEGFECQGKFYYYPEKAE
jgi:NAD(P)-dependent dehydrogenase (short-subunit alcohol dehydrogenase family)